MECVLTVVLFCLLLHKLPAVSTQATYHIRPTSESPCPYQDCLTLSEYAMETSRYTNSNNLTLLFLPGEHVLNTSIEFQFLDCLSLLGNQSSLPNVTSKIVCNNGTGTPLFTLINITFVEIKALSISKCGDQNSSDGYQNNLHVLRDTFSNITVAKSVVPAITALFLTNFQLVNCHLDRNFLPVLLNKSRLCVRDNIFSDNKGSFGGAMTVYSSTVVFLGMNTFWRNEAVVGGGVFASGSSLVLVGSTRLINNTADYGGSIGAVYTAITFEINNISISSNNIHSTTHSNDFLQNVAKHDGGGILLFNSILRHSQGVLNFTGNHAGNGGAISSHQSHISLNGFAMFERNSATGPGGAVSVWNGTWSSAVISFVGNSAANGGAVYATDSMFNSGTLSYAHTEALISILAWKFTEGYYSLFRNNSATVNGGAIAAERSFIMIISDATMLEAGTSMENSNSGQVGFVGNRAFNNGGGIFINNSSTLNISRSVTYVNNIAHEHGGAMFAHLTSTVAIDGNNTFIGNRAQYGGGMAITRPGYGKYHISYCGLPISGSALFSGETSLLNNAVERDGGGLYLALIHIQVFGNITYINNTAGFSGGGMYIDTVIFNISGIGMFINNSAVALNSWPNGNGGVMSAYCSHIEFKGEVSFVNNQAGGWGGGFCLLQTTLNITGIGHYLTNGARGNGGVISASLRSHVFLDGESLFSGNYAFHGGAIAVETSKTTINGKNTFSDNLARNGGAISANDGSAVTVSGTPKFFKNRATAGGAMYLYSSNVTVMGNVTYFYNNTAVFGGVINAVYSDITLYGRNIMARNFAMMHGGAVALSNCELRISSYPVHKVLVAGSLYGKTESAFVENAAEYSGGAVYAKDSNLEIKGVTSFFSNIAKVRRGYGGAIHAVHTTIVVLEGLHNFVNNSARYGGGLAFESYVPSQFLQISINTTIRFVSNHAQKHGGAIFVNDTADHFCNPSETIPERMCFINLGTTSASPLVRLPYGGYRNITECIGHAVFEGNMADDGGRILYGGGLYDCSVEFTSEGSCEYPACRELTCSMPGIKAIAALTHSSVKTLTSDPLNIMSDTYQVCLCDFQKPNCKQRNSSYTVYPGETVSVSANVVGRVDGIASMASVIHALISESKGVWLDKRQDTQAIDANCTFLEYTMFSSDVGSAKLTLSVDGPCQTPALPYYIHVRFQSCPPGFFSPFASCICERRLQRYTNSCDINTRAITRNGDFWVGFDHHSHGLILHPHCSFDYCKLETVSFTLNSTDLQCAHGRSGILCGACKSGYSLKFGSSQCSSCSNVFLLLFIPFAIAGFLLVVFLFICKVTVAAGTTSGLIFYANVLAVNKSVFFAASEANFLTVFIAWLNLDLGIETCFIDGMDMHTRTWLQFAFPLYIWLLVGIIVLVSRHSTSVARIIGPTNPVSVLATLFLLSYTKLLRTIIATLSFTTLDYPDDKSVTVWVYDGNIEYFKGKHIPLFLAGLLAFLLLFLPYTLLLLFGQWIEAGSSCKLLSWVNNPMVKYFLDAYHAPYKNRHRYWTGLLLLIRFVLFVISAVIDINSPRDPTVNLLALCIICSGLYVWVWNTGSVHKKWYNNILESSFILNLTILASGSLYLRVVEGNETVIVYPSVSIAFVTFLAIVIFHVVELLRTSRIWRITILPNIQNLKNIVTHHKDDEEPNEMTAPPTAPSQPVPTTFVELREPLLESQH